MARKKLAGIAAKAKKAAHLTLRQQQKQLQEQVVEPEISNAQEEEEDDDDNAPANHVKEVDEKLAQKNKERLGKLEELKLRRLEALNENRKIISSSAAVAGTAGDKGGSSNSNKKLEKLEEKKRRGEAVEDGVDLEREDNLSYTLTDVERWNAKSLHKEEKAQKGFTSYSDTAHKTYVKTIGKFVAPEGGEEYLRRKEGDPNFYREVNSLSYGTSQNDPTPAGMARLSAEYALKAKKRGIFSKRRKFDEEGDVTYINERNMAFNKKVERSFGAVTGEVKKAFERGTAL